MNMDIHNFNTRYNTNLNPHISNFTKITKGGLSLWNKDFQSPPSKHKVFNE